MVIINIITFCECGHYTKYLRNKNITDKKNLVIITYCSTKKSLGDFSTFTHFDISDVN